MALTTEKWLCTYWFDPTNLPLQDQPPHCSCEIHFHILFSWFPYGYITSTCNPSSDQSGTLCSSSLTASWLCIGSPLELFPIGKDRMLHPALFTGSYPFSIPPCSFTYCHPSPFPIGKDWTLSQTCTCSSWSSTPHHYLPNTSITILSCFLFAARFYPLLYPMPISTALFPVSFTSHWRWKQHGPLKQRHLTATLQGITTQNPEGINMNNINYKLQESPGLT